MTEEHQFLGGNVRCALKLHCQADTLPLQARSTASVTKTGGPKRFEETPSSATAQSQVVVFCSPGGLRNIESGLHLSQ